MDASPVSNDMFDFTYNHRLISDTNQSLARAQTSSTDPLVDSNALRDDDEFEDLISIGRDVLATCSPTTQTSVISPTSFDPVMRNLPTQIGGGATERTHRIETSPSQEGLNSSFHSSLPDLFPDNEMSNTEGEYIEQRSGNTTLNDDETWHDSWYATPSTQNHVLPELMVPSQPRPNAVLSPQPGPSHINDNVVPAVTKRPLDTEHGKPAKRLKQVTIRPDLRLGSPVHSSDGNDGNDDDDDARAEGNQAANRKTYELVLKGTRNFKNTASETTYSVRFHERWLNERIVNLETELREMFAEILSRVSRSHDDEDGVRIYLEHPELRHPIVVAPRAIKDMTPDAIMDCVEDVAQSEQDLAISDDMEIHVGVYRAVRGGATTICAEERALTSRSIVKITNPDDNLCLARALVVGIAYWNKTNTPEGPAKVLAGKQYDSLRKVPRRPGQITSQERKAREYHALANVPTDVPCDIRFLPQFEAALDVEVEVISVPHGKTSIYRSQPRAEGERPYTSRVFLWFTQLSEDDRIGHFDTITNMKGALGLYYYCHTCRKGGMSRKHTCSTTCLVCRSDQCMSTAANDTPVCQDCNMQCRSDACYTRHKQKAQPFGSKKNAPATVPSLCERFWRCTTCRQVLELSRRSKEAHLCGEYACQHCGEIQFGEHFCSMRARGLQSMSDKKIYFDVETDQSTGTHIANYIVAESACDACEDDEVTDTSKCVSCGSRCVKCWGRDKNGRGSFKTKPCVGCGVRRVKFSGYKAQDEFCRWVFTMQHNGFSCLAHNSKSFDSYFPYQYLLLNGCTPEVIMTGSKIMFMYQRKDLGIRFLDSLSFLPMALSKLPKTFGFETEHHKGWFPHKFNRPENQDYVGPFPPPEAYGADQMGVEARASFMAWHSRQTGTFNFRSEMDRYCTMDVEILRIACTKFRQLMKRVTGTTTEKLNPQTNQIECELRGGVDPFHSITIASVCLSIYKYMFLEESWSVLLKADHEEATATFQDPVWRDAKKTAKDGFQVKMATGEWVKTNEEDITSKTFLNSPIAVQPSGGYAARNTFSKVSMEWLSWQEHKTRRPIQHALKKGGEHAVMNEATNRKYRLDGYVKVDGKEIGYCFLGCVWHGCPSCYRNKTAKTEQQADVVPREPHTKQTLDQRYAMYVERRRYLTEEKGIKLVEIWEHEWTEMKRKNGAVKDFVSGLDIHERLEPRASFFGGRTNASRLYWDSRQGNRRRRAWYKDFTSLYPTVNKYDRYPVGTPQIILPDEIGDCVDINEYFGLVQCRVLPPRGLYHPVLPLKNKATGKLTFALCAHCASKAGVSQCGSKYTEPKRCKCSDAERALEGTWTTPELQVAIAEGYKILKIREVYHWAETMAYNPETGEDGLFSKYVNTFLKIKQESSGYPTWVKTEEDKEEYRRQYLEHEGIKLDPKSIEKNPGLRALAKLGLNSFCGKFGQRETMGKTTIVRHPADFYRILTDPAKTISDWTILSDDCMLVQWTNTAVFQTENGNTNVFIATFTTAWARTRLYAVLKRLGRRVLYWDTDSIIYETLGDEEDPLETGDYLGQLTDELRPGTHIVSFVSCGPKNYAYITSDGEVVCKVKGFSLNYTNAGRINFESMKAELFKWHEGQAGRGIIIENPSKICRDKLKGVLYNRHEKKQYNVVYNKRVVQPNLDTLPFGF